MIRLDLRGHGLSDKLTDPAAFQDGKIWAEDIRVVINAFRLNKPILVGWSYGGHIICDYICHYGQENLGGLIFVAAATEMGRDESRAMIGAEFLQLVPGLFSTDYATGSAALLQLIQIATYEELDAHTFYYLVGFNSATQPASRQGMLMRKLDNGAVLQAIKVPYCLSMGKTIALSYPPTLTILLGISRMSRASIMIIVDTCPFWRPRNSSTGT
jgi:non-heme chloroperoxidase